MSTSDMRSAVEALATRTAVTLPGAPLSAASFLGSGAYATVYSAALAADCPCGHAGTQVALKVTAPASVWEFYVQRQLAARVLARVCSAYLPALGLFVGSDRAAGAAPPPRRALGKRCAAAASDAGHAGVLVMPLGRHGTLLDLVNAHLVTGRPVTGSLLLYIALQLLQVRLHCVLWCMQCEHGTCITSMSCPLQQCSSN